MWRHREITATTVLICIKVSMRVHSEKQRSVHTNKQNKWSRDSLISGAANILSTKLQESQGIRVLRDQVDPQEEMDSMEFQALKEKKVILDYLAGVGGREAPDNRGPMVPTEPPVGEEKKAQEEWEAQWVLLVPLEPKGNPGTLGNRDLLARIVSFGYAIANTMSQPRWFMLRLATGPPKRTCLDFRTLLLQSGNSTWKL